MRILMALFLLAPFLVSQVAQTQGPAGEAAGGTATRGYTEEESAAMADAARKKAEATERARDAKLRRATRSICTGC